MRLSIRFDFPRSLWCVGGCGQKTILSAIRMWSELGLSFERHTKYSNRNVTLDWLNGTMAMFRCACHGFRNVQQQIYWLFGIILIVIVIAVSFLCICCAFNLTIYYRHTHGPNHQWQFRLLLSSIRRQSILIIGNQCVCVWVCVCWGVAFMFATNHFLLYFCLSEIQCSQAFKRSIAASIDFRLIKAIDFM